MKPTPRVDLIVERRRSSTGEALRQIDLDTLTPREALDALYALKRLASDGADS